MNVLANRRVLLLTNSHDVTSDVVVDHLGAENVFRFNVDLWSSYSLRIDQRSFGLADPTGRRIDESEVSHLYWRKPFDPRHETLVVGTEEYWLAAQQRYALREICNLARGVGVPMLVEPDAERRAGKLVQLRAAAAWFRVPQWTVWQGERPALSGEDWVVKSLVMEPVVGSNFLYVVGVETSALDTSVMWFCQRLIRATQDITVVYIAGRMHAFALDRRPMAGCDWRAEMTESALWHRVDWSAEHQLATEQLMDRLGLCFGRLDFVRDAAGELWFLEVNPNGQFAWLDPNGDDGLIADIVHALGGQV